MTEDDLVIEPVTMGGDPPTPPARPVVKPQGDSSSPPVPPPKSEEAPPAEPPPSAESILAELRSRLVPTGELPSHDTTAAVEPCAKAKKAATRSLLQRAIDKLFRRKDLGLSNLKTSKASVPTTIWYVWVGGPIPASYAARVGRTAQSNPGWQVKVLLSSTLSTSPEVFAQNQSALETAGAAVVPLEGPLAKRLAREGMLDPVLWEWQAQGIVNYGAISDILRVFLLKKEGGMYIDTDNTITTSLPNKVVPKYGFLYGAFGTASMDEEKKGANAAGRFDEDPSDYLALWNDDDPKTLSRKPYAVTNSVLLSVPEGQIINAYWDHIKGVYQPLSAATPEARDAKLRWPAKATDIEDKRRNMREKTLAHTGPRALETTFSTMTIKGENVYLLTHPSPSPFDVHTNEARHLMLDPKHVFIRSDNTWTRAVGPGDEA